MLWVDFQELASKKRMMIMRQRYIESDVSHLQNICGDLHCAKLMENTNTLLFWGLKPKWDDQTKLMGNKLTTDVSLNSKWLYSGFVDNKDKDPSNCLKKIRVHCKNPRG